MAKIGENISEEQKNRLTDFIPDPEREKFISHHRKLSPEELIIHMKVKGIDFSLMSEKEALERITRNTYYFKIGVYRANYEKGKDGKYLNLDFAYLDDLATLDMRLRYIILQIALDLEHSLKTKILNIITYNKDIDGYKIVKDFELQTGNSIQLIMEPSRSKTHYLYTLKRKHFQYPSVWVLLEVMKFGDFSRFVEFFYNYNNLRKKEVKDASNMIKYAKNIRNAAAHNNPILINIYNGYKINPDQKLVKLSEQIGINSDVYRNVKTNDILSLLYLHNTYSSDGIVKNRVMQIEEFLRRCERNSEYYTKNNNLLELYNTLIKVIDFYKSQ